MAQGQKAEIPFSSLDAGPSIQHRPRHWNGEHRDKGEIPLSEHSTAGETSLKTDWTMMPPPLVAPATVEEQNMSTTTNEFMNPNSTKIPKGSILALFPNEEAWKTVSTAARENSHFHRRSIMAQILYLSCLKNSILPQLLHRGNLLAQRTWPFSDLSQDVVDNQRAWIAWAVSLDETITNVLKQINWLDLLEDEYVAADPLWTGFWRLHNEDQQQEAAYPCTDEASATQLELDKIYVTLAVHNRRRLFLQMKMMQGRDWVARLFEQVPPWIEWEEVVSEMLNAPLGGNESAWGQKSGFVEEMEDEEEFEL